MSSSIATAGRRNLTLPVLGSAGVWLGGIFGRTLAGMDYRRLGASGLKVPALSFGAATFGGRGPFFSEWGNTGGAEARRIVDLCLDAGVTLFDTADIYGGTRSEEFVGRALAGAAIPRHEQGPVGTFDDAGRVVVPGVQGKNQLRFQSR